MIKFSIYKSAPVQPANLLRFVTLLCLLWIVPASAETKFKRIPTQFIAARADGSAKSGNNAHTWGLWKVDPGPRGVWLSLFPILKAAGGFAPFGWQWDQKDWWLDENGLIMEKPKFPLAAGKYLVTGTREVTTVLTVYPKEQNGDQQWELADGATIHDVTHLGCLSARYTPKSDEKSCSPADAPIPAFKIAPGTAMPTVTGCLKQDYTVLFVVGIAQQ